MSTIAYKIAKNDTTSVDKTLIEALNETLIKAVNANRYSLVKSLIDEGANVNAKNTDEWTASMTMLFRKHPVSLLIQIKVCLLQMDVMRSDRVMMRFQLEDESYHAVYHRADRIFTYLHEYAKVHYEAYYPGKSFTIKRIVSWEIRGNKNRLRAIHGLASL